MPLANGTPTPPVNTEDIPEERLRAAMVIEATVIPVGNHFYGSVDAVTNVALTVPEDAQWLQLQPLDQCNIRYRIDGETVSPNIGFQITSGQLATIPCAVDIIYICGESSGTYQGQFVR